MEKLSQKELEKEILDNPKDLSYRKLKNIMAMPGGTFSSDFYKELLSRVHGLYAIDRKMLFFQMPKEYLTKDMIEEIVSSTYSSSNTWLDCFKFIVNYSPKDRYDSETFGYILEAFFKYGVPKCNYSDIIKVIEKIPEELKNEKFYLYFSQLVDFHGIESYEFIKSVPENYRNDLLILQFISHKFKESNLTDNKDIAEVVEKIIKYKKEDSNFLENIFKDLNKINNMSKKEQVIFTYLFLNENSVFDVDSIASTEIENVIFPPNYIAIKYLLTNLSDEECNELFREVYEVYMCDTLDPGKSLEDEDERRKAYYDELSKIYCETRIHKVSEVLRDKFSGLVPEEMFSRIISSTTFLSGEDYAKKSTYKRTMGENGVDGSIISCGYHKPSQLFGTMIHESIHMISRFGVSNLYDTGLYRQDDEISSGINEAVTEYLTKLICKDSLSGYDDTVDVIKELVTFGIIKDDEIIECYFSHDLDKFKRIIQTRTNCDLESINQLLKCMFTLNVTSLAEDKSDDLKKKIADAKKEMGTITELLVHDATELRHKKSLIEEEENGKGYN